MPPKNRITPDQFVSLVGFEDLPYLKHIELTRYSPKHFGLEKWTRLFVIPDYWMRKIYRKDVYASSTPSKNVEEQMTSKQRQILYDWLENHSPFRREPTIDDRRSDKGQLSYDDMIDLLDIPPVRNGSSCDSEATITIGEEPEGESKIPFCYGHKIQPEHLIFEKAINRMSNLSSEEEAEFKRLVADKEFMDLLQASIGDFLGKSVTTTSRAKSNASEKQA